MGLRLIAKVVLNSILTLVVNCNGIKNVATGSYVRSKTDVNPALTGSEASIDYLMAVSNYTPKFIKKLVLIGSYRRTDIVMTNLVFISKLIKNSVSL